jgi:D-amino-acid dehydrogenase
LSFSHTQPWATRASLWSFLKAFFKADSFLSIKDFNGEFRKWFWQFLKSSGKADLIAERNFKLGGFSRQVLAGILREEKIDFSYKADGILHFYRSDKLFNQAIIHAKKQRSLGCKLEILSAKECVKKEPTLTKMFDEEILKGGVFYPDDASGDCLAFVRGLEWICKNKLGVEFHYGCEVKNLLNNHQKITGINTNQGVFVGDVYLDCLGSFGNSLLSGIGVETKIHPIRGYSLSIPSDQMFLSPNLSLSDSENKIVYSKLGNVFRAAGTIEVCGLKDGMNRKNIDFLKKVVRESYSDFGDLNNAKEWSGFRPYRPESLPLVGRNGKYGNLFLNVGHGSLGWTMSFATARIVADRILGKVTDEGFGFLGE